MAGEAEEIVVEPDIQLDAVVVEPDVVVPDPVRVEADESLPAKVVEMAPPSLVLVQVEVHEPPPTAHAPTPPQEVDVEEPVLPPADIPVAAVVDIVVLSDDDDDEPPVAAEPVIVLANSPPPALELVIVDLVADEPSAAPAALCTLPVSRQVPRGPPRPPRVNLGPRCFNCQRCGHYGNKCPYPPAVDRPCFNCGLQGHEIATCPTPAPFAADNRLRLLERQQQLQAAQLRQLRTRRRLFRPPYTYAHQQLPPLAMWLGPQYALPPPQPMALLFINKDSLFHLAVGVVDDCKVRLTNAQQIKII